MTITQPPEQQKPKERLTYRRVAALIALPLALIALIPSTIGIELLRREINNRCTDAAVNREAIRGTVIDGLPTLGYRYDGDADRVVRNGPPTVGYYRTHPAERDAALERTEKVLDRFPTINCG